MQLKKAQKDEEEKREQESAATGHDVAAILHMGETFFERMLKTYPEMEAMVPRTHFFRSTYILQEALNALRDGDASLFDTAISTYQ